MKVIIVEDEKAARERLLSLLREVEPNLEVVASAASVRETVHFFQKHVSAELAFFDIQLTDGNSFDAFRQCTISIPVIFTTAFDQYMLEAFHANSIDYLLKPLKKQELAQALEKYRRLRSHFNPDISGLLRQLQGQGGYLQRVAGSRAGAAAPVPVNDIAWFASRHKVTFLRTFAGESLVVDKPLSALEGLLDPARFRRVNRQYIVNINAIQRLKPHYKGKLLLALEPSPGEEVTVSQEQAAEVKGWLEL